MLDIRIVFILVDKRIIEYEVLCLSLPTKRERHRGSSPALGSRQC